MQQKDWSGKCGAAFCFLHDNNKQNAAVRRSKLLKKQLIGGFSAKEKKDEKVKKDEKEYLTKIVKDE